MEALRAIVVDDESLARKGLRIRLEQIAGIEIVGECVNGKEALNSVTELKPDIMFLDIQMPGMSGFDVVSNLQQDNMPLVVFVTAFDQYAVEAFDVPSTTIIISPFFIAEIASSILSNLILLISLI